MHSFNRDDYIWVKAGFMHRTCGTERAAQNVPIKAVDLLPAGLYNIKAYVRGLKFRSMRSNLVKKEELYHENDISTEKKTEKKRARLQKKNEDQER